MIRVYIEMKQSMIKWDRMTTTKNVKRKHGQIWKRNVNNDKQQQKLKGDGMQQQHEMKNSQFYIVNTIVHVLLG